MKTLAFPLLLLFAFSMLIALESEPSNVIGIVRYTIVAGNNLVALPMDQGLTMASAVAASYSGTCDAVSYFGADQAWHTAYVLGGEWYDDFEVGPGDPLLMYSYGTESFFSMGNLPDIHTFSIALGNNLTMIPLNRFDLSLASSVGLSMSAGPVDAVSYFGSD